MQCAAVTAAGSLSWPTISSMKSNNAQVRRQSSCACMPPPAPQASPLAPTSPLLILLQEHEQGSVQGALYGARALASGALPPRQHGSRSLNWLRLPVFHLPVCGHVPACYLQASQPHFPLSAERQLRCALLVQARVPSSLRSCSAGSPSPTRHSLTSQVGAAPRAAAGSDVAFLGPIGAQLHCSAGTAGGPHSYSVLALPSHHDLPPPCWAQALHSCLAPH